jgi:hypothetical protein
VTFVRHKVDGLLQALYAVNIDGSHRKLIAELPFRPRGSDRGSRPSHHH